MSIASLWRELARSAWCQTELLLAGSVVDVEGCAGLSGGLGLPVADHVLSAPAGTHAQRTAAVMAAYECLPRDDRPIWLVVAGHGDPCLAATISAKKLHHGVARMGAGLRGLDGGRSTALNRGVIDALADVLWTASAACDGTLHAEGIAAERIECVGPAMTDAVERVMGEGHRSGLLRGGEAEGAAQRMADSLRRRVTGGR